jgi:hypothetical protein
LRRGRQWRRRREAGAGEDRRRIQPIIAQPGV